MAAVAGLFVVGLGVAGQYPLGAAMVMALSGGQPDRAIAVMSIGVGLASGLGPFVLGALADQIGVQTAFLVVPALCVAAALVHHRRAAMGAATRRRTRASLTSVDGRVGHS